MGWQFELGLPVSLPKAHLTLQAPPSPLVQSKGRGLYLIVQPKASLAVKINGSLMFRSSLPPCSFLGGCPLRFQCGIEGRGPPGQITVGGTS